MPTTAFNLDVPHTPTLHPPFNLVVVLLSCSSSLSTRLALDRATATLEGLAGLENRILKADAAFKGKPRKAGSRPAKKIEKLEMQREKVVSILEAGSKRLVPR